MSVVTRASAPREQVDKGKKPDKVIVESVTVWEGRRHRRLSRRDQNHGLSIDAAGASDRSPIWVEMRLECPVERWVDPWDPPPDPIDWSDFEGVAQGLGFTAPVDDDSLPRDLVAAVLQRLPCINELGELRSLERLLRTLGESAVAVPLVGLRPTSTLGDQPKENGRLEFVLVRVNLAMVGRYVFTVRLPDRLYSGVPTGTERRVAYAGDDSPPLNEFMRHIGPEEHPVSDDIGAAIALYLSATCACVAEYARRRLVDIELTARESLSKETDGGELSQAHVLRDLFTDVFETRGALSAAEEELVRLLQRLDETEMPKEFPFTVTRYERALAELRDAEEELRLLGDWLANQVEAMQVKVSDRQLRHAEEQEKERKAREDKQMAHAGRRQMTLTIAGTVLIVSTLIASVFGEKDKLPHPASWLGLGAMVLLMLGVSSLVLFGVSRLERPPRGSAKRPLLARRGVAVLSLVAIGSGILLLILE